MKKHAKFKHNPKIFERTPRKWYKYKSINLVDSKQILLFKTTNNSVILSKILINLLFVSICLAFSTNFQSNSIGIAIRENSHVSHPSVESTNQQVKTVTLLDLGANSSKFNSPNSNNHLNWPSLSIDRASFASPFSKHESDSGSQLKRLLSRPRSILSSFVPQVLTKQLILKRPENQILPNFRLTHQKEPKISHSFDQNNEQIFVSGPQEHQLIIDHQVEPQAIFHSFAPEQSNAIVFDTANQMRPTNPMMTFRSSSNIERPNLSEQPNQAYHPSQQQHPIYQSQRQNQNQNQPLQIQQAPVMKQQQVVLIHQNLDQPEMHASQVGHSNRGVNFDEDQNSSINLDGERKLRAEEKMKQIDHMIKSELDTRIKANEMIGIQPLGRNVSNSVTRPPEFFVTREPLLLASLSIMKPAESETDDEEEAPTTMMGPLVSEEEDWRPTENPTALSNHQSISFRLQPMEANNNSTPSTQSQFPVSLTKSQEQNIKLLKLSRPFWPPQQSHLIQLSKQKPFVPSAPETIASFKSNGSDQNVLMTSNDSAQIDLISADKSINKSPHLANSNGQWKNVIQRQKERQFETESSALFQQDVPIATNTENDSSHQSSDQIEISKANTNNFDRQTNKADRRNIANFFDQKIKKERESDINLSETLRRLRETKARIRLIQAQLNASHPELSHLLVDQEASDFLSPSSETELADRPKIQTSWVKSWPRDNHSATSIEAQGALGLPLGIYHHSGPLAAPARFVAAAFGRAAQNAAGQTQTSQIGGRQASLWPSSAPILLSSSISVASSGPFEELVTLRPKLTSDSEESTNDSSNLGQFGFSVDARRQKEQTNSSNRRLSSENNNGTEMQPEGASKAHEARYLKSSSSSKQLSQNKSINASSKFEIGNSNLHQFALNDSKLVALSRRPIGSQSNGTKARDLESNSSESGRLNEQQVGNKREDSTPKLASNETFSSSSDSGFFSQLFAKLLGSSSVSASGNFVANSSHLVSSNIERRGHQPSERLLSSLGAFAFSLAAFSLVAILVASRCQANRKRHQLNQPEEQQEVRAAIKNEPVWTSCSQPIGRPSLANAARFILAGSRDRHRKSRRKKQSKSCCQSNNCSRQDSWLLQPQVEHLNGGLCAARKKLPFGAASSVKRLLPSSGDISDSNALEVPSECIQRQRIPMGGTRMRMMSAVDERATDRHNNEMNGDNLQCLCNLNGQNLDDLAENERVNCRCCSSFIEISDGFNTQAAASASKDTFDRREFCISEQSEIHCNCIEHSRKLNQFQVESKECLINNNGISNESSQHRKYLDSEKQSASTCCHRLEVRSGGGGGEQPEARRHKRGAVLTLAASIRGRLRHKMKQAANQAAFPNGRQTPEAIR